jgi:hypothetical protein
MSDDLTWKQFYISRDGLGVGGSELPLLDICPDSPMCWASITPDEQSRFSMAHPFIGRRYGEGRLLVYGQNLNLGRDNPPTIWPWLAEFVETVSQYQQDGWKRKTGLGDDKYQTPFWHFSIAYATVITNHLGVTRVDDPYENIVGDSATWEMLALSEVVKCQPFRGNGEPSAQMFQTCARRFACYEPSQLQPAPVAGRVVGMEAARALADAHGASVTEHTSQAFVSWLAGNTLYFGVPHPARPGFSRADLIVKFDSIVGNLLGPPRT